MSSCCSSSEALSSGFDEDEEEEKTQPMVLYSLCAFVVLYCDVFGVGVVPCLTNSYCLIYSTVYEITSSSLLVSDAFFVNPTASA